MSLVANRKIITETNEAAQALISQHFITSQQAVFLIMTEKRSRIKNKKKKLYFFITYKTYSTRVNYQL
jgi:hypothetical protein